MVELYSDSVKLLKLEEHRVGPEEGDQYDVEDRDSDGLVECMRATWLYMQADCACGSVGDPHPVRDRDKVLHIFDELDMNVRGR